MRSGFAEFRQFIMKDPMEVILPLGIFAATLLVCWVARRLVLRALNAWTARTGSRMGMVLHRALRGPTVIWALILAVHLAFQGSDLPVKWPHPVANALLVLWIVSLTLMSMRVVGNLVRYSGSQMPGAMPVTTLTQIGRASCRERV